MCIEKQVLIKKKKKFTKGLNMLLPLEAWIEKTVHGMEIPCLSTKKKLKIKKNKKKC